MKEIFIDKEIRSNLSFFLSAMTANAAAGVAATEGDAEGGDANISLEPKLQDNEDTRERRFTTASSSTVLIPLSPR